MIRDVGKSGIRDVGKSGIQFVVVDDAMLITCRLVITFSA